MSLQDEETDCHWCVGLRQQLMSTGEEFVQRDEVAKWFTHLGSVDGNHVVVHPAVNHVIALWSYRLCDFTFVVRENQVHSSSVNIEVFTQVFASHSGTFGVPSGETVAPWRRPAHDMFRLCLFPKGEVGGIAFFALSVEVTGGIQYVVQITSGKFSVVVIFIVFGYIEVDGAFAFIGVSGIQNLLYQLDLFNDMSWSMWLNAWRKYIQRFHCFMIAVQEILNNLHWFQLFQTCFLGDLVFSVIGIVFQMTYVGNISYVAYFIS